MHIDDEVSILFHRVDPGRPHHLVVADHTVLPAPCSRADGLHA
jgi:hypothetical protein